ncbi:MAG TPA: tetratricopeptide repeat protein [Candidatus Ozemobacteraceae bacterium]|nr:tetratricopeptide repeat protein [Candidatus Ozemobacteraceae bacterium]
MKRIIVGVVTAGLIAVTPLWAAGAREGKVHGSYINVRSEANHSSSVVTKKLRGDRYTIEFEEKGWLKVVFDDGTRGWIFNSVVEKQLAKEAAAEPKHASEPPVASHTAAPALPKGVADSAKPGEKKDTAVAATAQKTTGEQRKPDAHSSVKMPEGKESQTGKADASKPETGKEKAASAQKAGDKAAADEKAKAEAKTPAKAAEKTGQKEQTPAKAEEKAKEDSKAKKIDEKKSADEKQKSAKKDEPEKSAKHETSVKQAEIPAAKAVSTSKSAADFYHEAIELYEKKRYQEALDANRAALQQAPRNAEILNNIGNCLFKMGKIQDAITNWKEALKSAPKQAKICNNLGIAYYQIDENDRAVEFYKKAILFEPQFADAYYNLASVYGFKGQFRDALDNYRKYLEFNPDATMKKLTEERIDYCQKQLDAPKKDKK